MMMTGWWGSWLAALTFKRCVGLNPRIKNYLYFTIFITFLVLAYQLYTDLSADYKNPDSQLQDKVNLPPNESTDLALRISQYLTSKGGR
jgi:hypothetical protein